MEETPRKFFPGERSAAARTESPGAGAKQDSSSSSAIPENAETCGPTRGHSGHLIWTKESHPSNSYNFKGGREPAIDKKKGGCEAAEELGRTSHWRVNHVRSRDRRQVSKSTSVQTPAGYCRFKLIWFVNEIKLVANKRQ